MVGDPEKKSEFSDLKIWGQVLMWWAKSAPLVRIGLTDLPKYGWVAEEHKFTV